MVQVDGEPEPLAILPLAKGALLLPGVTLRIPIGGRSDIPALLTAIYSTREDAGVDRAVPMIGCIPRNSPLLRSDGQQLLPDTNPQSEATEDGDEEDDNAKKGQIDHRKLFMYGTEARIAGIQGRRSEDLALIVEGVRRFRLDRFVQMRPYFMAEVAYVDVIRDEATDPEHKQAFIQLKELSLKLVQSLNMASYLPRSSTILSPFLRRQLEHSIAKRQLSEAGQLADFMTNIIEASIEDKLRVLAALSIPDRLEQVIELITRQLDKIKDNSKIMIMTTTVSPRDSNRNRESRDKDREVLLRNALRSLGGIGSSRGSGPADGDASTEDEPNDVEDLKKKIAEAELSVEAQKIADRELKRLAKLNPVQAEYSVCRTYIETIAEIPWSKQTEDRLGPETLPRARKQLDDDHYGLQKIKKRLLEYLAVLRLKQAINDNLDKQIERVQESTSLIETTEKADPVAKQSHISPSYSDSVETRQISQKRPMDKSPILLLVGPPGTGKTSLAKSVATALGRKFHRISLGGVRDEAEIRGHRRTYVAAMPGLIISGLRKVGVKNPVFLLDEIDKVGGSNFHGDPSAAMLEVLDPEQNHTFSDHYLNIPFDLSKVLFIATANTLDTIPPALLDRMETISLSGYTTVEKRHIAIQHLIPKQINSNGLGVEQVILSTDVIDTIVSAYTREAGVRNLEREIGSVCRYKAVEYSDTQDSSSTAVKYKPDVSVADLQEILGIEKFEQELAEKASVPGIVTGLVAYSSGGQGSILFIEVADMPGSGRVQLTGKLGDVLKESVEVALTWVKAHAFELGLAINANEDIMKNRSVHVHCPSGAVPKDGPSAGLAHTIALVSLFSGKTVPPEIAMTGEISLRGRVMPVGGIKEKLIGALRADVKTVLMPVQNRKDVKDVPQEVKDGLEIIHVEHIWDAMRTIWPNTHWPGEHQIAAIESRL